MRSKALRIRLRPVGSLAHMMQTLIAQAEDRQRKTRGKFRAGAVLTHLVEAKLDCTVGRKRIWRKRPSEVGPPTATTGELFIGDVTIHVTTSPGVALILRCKSNLDEGVRPVVITSPRGLRAAEGLADTMGLGDRIDFFEFAQFLALNIHKMGNFASDDSKEAVREIVARYNQIVREIETDPSLEIELA